MRCVAPWMAGMALLALASSLEAADAPPEKAAAPAASNAPLPLTEVVLYSSGVGYFQRDGRVEGSARLDLRFKTEDVNDLLKSLVVQDFDGGRVSTVTYGSRDPLAKTLKSFGIDLTSNPSLSQLLGQIRGERIELQTPKPMRGTILGVETKQEPAGETKVVPVEYLDLLTDEGLRSLPLAQVGRIKLLNERLDAELRQALEALAGGHDTQKKAVALRFDGRGRRRVSVAYIAETPVWKTSYRLVLDEKGKPFLQGWAIVENTTDDDWNEVRLALVSGRPISFRMDLYQPLYVQRPLVVPELYASLRPQVYGEAMESLGRARMLQEAAKVAESAPAPPAGMSGMAGGGSNYAFRGMASAGAVAVNAPARQAPGLNQGVASAAQALPAGELFQYAIKTPVSLARQKSAMLPIVSQEVEGKKLSIYNSAVQPKYPLNGFRLKNTSTLHLMQGPITVFDGGSYAGDARIEDLAPGQERLLSYAMDLGAEVEPVAEPGQQDLVSARLSKGTIVVTHKMAEAKTYNVKNRDRKKKVILIEHPFRADWQLKEPSEPSERTREVYRFAVPVAAEGLARLLVREEQQTAQAIQIASLGLDAIAYYVKAPQVSAKVKEALQKVVELRDRLGRTAGERTRREARISEITQEQARIRENMTRLAQNSELYTRYVKKLDEQETELEKIHQEIETIKATEAKQQNELSEYLLGLELD